jgi:hypothetical protein
MQHLSSKKKRPPAGKRSSLRVVDVVVLFDRRWSRLRAVGFGCAQLGWSKVYASCIMLC